LAIGLAPAGAALARASGMTKWILGAMVAVLVTAAARRADACGDGGGHGLEAAGVALLGLDLAFPLADLGEDKLGPTTGRLEMLVMMPQMLMAVGLLGGVVQDGPLEQAGNDVRFLVGLTAVSVGCFAHGFAVAMREEPPAVTVTPLVVPGDDGPTTGLGLSGIF